MNRRVTIAALAALTLMGWTGALAEIPATGPAAAQASVPDKKAEKEADPVEASLVPVGATELRLTLLSYSGEVVVVKAVPHGSAVKAGDAVVWLEARGLATQLATAKNDLLVAQAALDKAKADGLTGAEADRIALEAATEDLTLAKANVTWFETVDGPAMLKESELRVKGATDSVEDQGDELDQLKKMYKSEELTNATADIVVKRALRNYENGKVNLELTRASAQKMPKQDYPVAKARVSRALATSENAMNQVKATQAQSAVSRATGLAAAEIALKKAAQTVSDLAHDEAQMTVKAATDGAFYHGYWAAKAWANGDLRMLTPGEKIAGGSIVGTVAAAGKLGLSGDVPDDQWKALVPGSKLKVKVGGATGAELNGVVTEVLPEARPGGTAMTFRASLSDVPAWMIAGMKAKVETVTP